MMGDWCHPCNVLFQQMALSELSQQSCHSVNTGKVRNLLIHKPVSQTQVYVTDQAQGLLMLCQEHKLLPSHQCQVQTFVQEIGLFLSKVLTHNVFCKIVMFVTQQFSKYKRQLCEFWVVSNFRNTIMMSVTLSVWHFHVFFINILLCAWIMIVFYMQPARHIRSINFTILAASTYIVLFKQNNICSYMVQLCQTLLHLLRISDIWFPWPIVFTKPCWRFLSHCQWMPRILRTLDWWFNVYLVLL